MYCNFITYYVVIIPFNTYNTRTFMNPSSPLYFNFGKSIFNIQNF